MRRLLIALAFPFALSAQAVPELPRASVDTRIPTPVRTIRVPANDAAALQSALNAAVGGDEIVLPMGARYVGAFTLPPHVGTVVVTVRSDSVSAPGIRVTPATAARFAAIITRTVEPAIAAPDLSANWRLVSLAVRLEPPAPDNYGMIVLGGRATRRDSLARDIVLDRVYVTAGDMSTSRCVALNGDAMAVVNSWLADCHAKGRDTQGIVGWGGGGPFLIENNHIEGAGQNIMFGGADPRIAGVTPSDITIRNNHLWKPLSWGGKWTVKAAFELKHAQRVLFEGNVTENHWIDAQVGYALLFQTANQDGTAPWSKIWDVTVRDNVFRNSTSGINILSRTTILGRLSDDPMRRVLFQNNLFVDVGRDPFAAPGNATLVQLLGDHEDVALVGNTFLPPNGAAANAAVVFDGLPNKRLTLASNVFGTTTYGIFGSGVGEGTRALTQYAPGATVTGNTIAGRITSLYPPGNNYPATVDSLTPGGADRGRIALATAGARSGFLSPPLPPTVPPVVLPPPIVAPPIAGVLTCEGAPVGFAIVQGSEVQSSRTERVTVTRGLTCLGVTTLASSSRYLAHIRTASGWRTIPQQFNSRAAAESAVIAAGGR